MSKVTDESGIMQAIIQERYGSAEVLEFRAVKKPTPQPDEVLIKVHAAGVDRGTWHLMEGKPYLLRIFGYGLRRPKVTIPGHDVAGIVRRWGRKSPNSTSETSCSVPAADRSPNMRLAKRHCSL